MRQVLRQARAAWKLSRILRRRRARAVLSWMSKAHVVGGVAAKLAGVPAFWFQHGLPAGHWLDRLATAIPARMVLACSAASAAAQSRMRPRRPVDIVYPGIDLARFDRDGLPTPAEARRRLSLPTGVPLVGIVGRLQRWKGMHVLIEAMVRVRGRFPAARCVVVGGTHALEPHYEAQLRRRVTELELDEAVIFAGFRRDVELWMQSLDVVVHASDREPFGLVVVEAMALGKAVIASAEGGPTEIVTPGVDGVLVPYGDHEELAEAICRYLESPALREQHGRAARGRAAQFSTGRFARAIARSLLVSLEATT
jgi:glycosyltransferase involved in cell wall biosynthesis